MCCPPAIPRTPRPSPWRSVADARRVATPHGTACRAMVDRACGAAGYVPDVPFQANEFGVLAAFAGLGVALIPEIALGAIGEGTVARPGADVPVTRRIYVAARRGGLGRPALAALRAAAANRPEWPRGLLSMRG